MRLEHLFDGEMWYVGDGAWVYGEREAIGYGSGEGHIAGPRLRGDLRWSNTPRRREDGVWLPDVNGYLHTDDGASILVAFRGSTLPERAPGAAREMVCALTLRSADPRYAWVDNVVAIIEALHQPDSGRMRIRAFACIHDGEHAFMP